MYTVYFSVDEMIILKWIIKKRKRGVCGLEPLVGPMKYGTFPE
jgi:hypothetical protein